LGHDHVAVPDGTTATAPGTSTQNVTTGGINMGAESYEAPPVGTTASARKEDEQAPTSTQNVTTGGINMGAGSHEAPPVGTGIQELLVKMPTTEAMDFQKVLYKLNCQVLLYFCQPEGLKQPKALKELV
jgi:hypothetical protein